MSLFLPVLPFLLLQMCGGNPDFLNIKDYFPLSGQCLSSQQFSSQEFLCHKRHLDALDGIAGEVGPKQESEDYKKLICCNLWLYFDCLSNSLSECSNAETEAFAAFPANVNPISVYCADYPHHTFRCWRFPLWALLLCAFAALSSVVVLIVSVWFWRKSQITYWRRRRRY